MLKIAVVIEKRKLKLFKKHLKRAGFKYTKCDGPIDDSWNLIVDTDEPDRLYDVVQKACAEANRRHTLH